MWGKFTKKFKKKEKREEKKKKIHKKVKKKIGGKKRGIFKFFNWRNISIGNKYITSFSVAAILFLISGIIVYNELSDVKKDIDQIEHYSLRTHEMSKLASLMQIKDLQIADFVITRSELHVRNFEEATMEFNELADRLEPMMISERQQKSFAVIKDNDSRINEIFNDLRELNEDSKLIAVMRTRSSDLSSSTAEATQSLIENIYEDQEEVTNRANLNIDSSIFILIIATVIAIIFGVIVMLLISRAISKHLRNVVDITTEVADGNLTVASMDYQGKDEVGQLVNAINRMKDNIQTILIKVDEAAQSVSRSSEELNRTTFEVKEGSEQVATTMDDLSTGAEVQANNASELSERMGDFVNNIRRSGEEGQNVATSSLDVLKLTTEGTALMGHSVKQMSQIDAIVLDAVKRVEGLDKQSEAITHLVQLIKGIADQTNLLALNAAIEAARAGEHGKGFAVVADEVRKLAEQVSTSVSEITGVVTNIQKETHSVVSTLNKGYEEVKEGTAQIEQTGKNFGDIERSISDMVEKVNGISNNLKQIEENSHQMDDFIQEIASVSEESAAGVEQAAATIQETASAMDEVSNSSGELEKLAEQLNAEINVFKLREQA